MGDFSITTILLLGISTWHGVSAREALEHKDRAALFACTTAAGLFLYPLTLGAGTWDPYELGYRPLALLAVLIVLAVVGRLRGYRAAAFVPIIILAWWAGLLESTNLWDYLLDPLVAIYGLVWLVTALVGQALDKRRPNSHSRCRKVIRAVASSRPAATLDDVAARLLVGLQFQDAAGRRLLQQLAEGAEAVVGSR